MPIKSKQQPPYYQQGTYIKIYTALISQEATSNPTSIILQNDIGQIIWTRIEAGLYRGTLANAFPLQRTWCITLAVDIIDSGNLITIWNETANNVAISTANNGTQQDDILNGQPIKIEVYTL